MKIKSKLIILLALCTLSMPVHAKVGIQDTFTFENITDTFLALSPASGTPLNYYIIASDNTVMGKGPNILGVNSNSFANTGNSWVTISRGESGVPINNIVKIAGSNYANLAFLDAEGDAYLLGVGNYFPKKIEAGDVKFKEIEQFHMYSTSGHYALILISEDGHVYRYMNDTLEKLTYYDGSDYGDAEYIKTFHYKQESTSNTYINGMIKHTNGDVSLLNYTGIFNCRRLHDVVDVYTENGGAYILYSSGKLARYDHKTNTVTNMQIPEGEKFVNMVGWCDINANNTTLLITDKNIYKLGGLVMTKISVEMPEDINIVALKRNIVVGDNGKYYLMDYISGTNYKLTEISGIDGWINENPIVLNSKLAYFKIDRNTIYKRPKTYDFEFSLVTKKTPKSFNIYYCKDFDLSNKENWKLIESEVARESLNPTDYETGYVDSLGTPVNGSVYKYSWGIGDEDLAGIHLIVEPVYE